MNTNNIRIKQTVDGLIIYFGKDDDFEKISNNLCRKMEKAGRFFNGASLNIRYRGRKLKKEEEERLTGLLESITGAEVSSFKGEEPEEDDCEPPGICCFNGIEKGITMYRRGTVRSGQSLHYFGNIVILGDVNPGRIQYSFSFYLKHHLPPYMICLYFNMQKRACQV